MTNWLRDVIVKRRGVAFNPMAYPGCAGLGTLIDIVNKQIRVKDL